MTRIALLLLVSCGVTDLLDGDIEDKRNCCAFVVRSKIRACVAGFLEPERCQVWSCPTSEGYVCRSLEGDVIDPPPGWEPPR